MVERIMLCKLVDPSQREEVASLTRAALYDLEGLEELSVGLPADAASERSWDMSVVLLFSTLAQQNAVLDGPTFKTLYDRLSERCAVLKAWSFERHT